MLAARVYKLLGVRVRAFNPNTREAEAGQTEVAVQPRLLSEIISTNRTRAEEDGPAVKSTACSMFCSWRRPNLVPSAHVRLFTTTYNLCSRGS